VSRQQWLAVVLWRCVVSCACTHRWPKHVGIESLIINIELVASCWFSLFTLFTMHGHKIIKLVNGSFSSVTGNIAISSLKKIFAKIV